MARDDDARMYELPGYRVRDLGLAESTLERVRAMCEDAHGDYLAVLRDGTEVRVGRRFRARLQARLGQAL